MKDGSNQLQRTIFSYRTHKNGNVVIYWNALQSAILRGRSAEKFLVKVECAQEQEAQLLMAKVTGDFKRGNERYDSPKSHYNK
ncbi:hypothetical protein U27_03727 [Candidatus Vecturithrix granuli]|uniref:Uncharacterized protein n=1 Tax=Vecturithrix granuli TaxID=1499967 RepID=A0A081BWQ8_VECG1|nr:hypothetical protein U27_03727 [Candidatus Vecturithrix granuli]